MIGYDAFQEADITGISLPITKHNYLVTEIEDLSDTIKDFVKITEAHGLAGRLVSERKDVETAITWARSRPGTTLLEFRVKEENIVYPIAPAGAGLHQMIRRPLLERFHTKNRRLADLSITVKYPTIK